MKIYVKNRKKILFDKMKNDIDDDFLDLEFDTHISISGFFVLESRIFVMMRSTNDICCCVLEMFVMMRSISDL